MHQGPSYLVALDRQTGDVAWKQDRATDAPAEARDSYTTPPVVEHEEQELIVVLGSDHVTTNDAGTGKELWRSESLNPGRRGNYRSIASPALSGDFIVAPYSRGSTLTATRLNSAADATESHVAWSVNISASDVPTPVSDNGRIYLCSDRGNVTCLDGKSGKELWTEALPRNRYACSSSPALADGHLYLTREDGTTFVMKVGNSPQLVATNALRDNTYSTPVFADGQVFQRTSDYLFCFGKK